MRLYWHRLRVDGSLSHGRLVGYERLNRDTIAQRTTARAAALRALAKAHPDASFDVLWDDGSQVPVMYREDALERATGVRIAVSWKRLVLLPYFEIGDIDEKMRVYVLPHRMDTFYAQIVLDRLPLADVVKAMRVTR